MWFQSAAGLGSCAVVFTCRWAVSASPLSVSSPKAASLFSVFFFFLWVLGAFPKQWPNIPRQLLARCSNLLNPVRVCRGVLLQPFLCCVLVLASVCTGTELLCS